MIDFACKRFVIEDIIKCAFGLTRSEMRLFQYLVDHPGEVFSSEDLAKEIKLDLTTVQRGLKKLHEANVLLRSQVNQDGGGYHFTYAIVPPEKLRQEIRGLLQKWLSRVDDALEKWP